MLREGKAPGTRAAARGPGDGSRNAAARTGGSGRTPDARTARLACGARLGAAPAQLELRLRAEPVGYGGGFGKISGGTDGETSEACGFSGNFPSVCARRASLNSASERKSTAGGERRRTPKPTDTHAIAHVGHSRRPALLGLMRSESAQRGYVLLNRFPADGNSLVAQAPAVSYAIVFFPTHTIYRL